MHFILFLFFFPPCLHCLVLPEQRSFARVQVLCRNLLIIFASPWPLNALWLMIWPPSLCIKSPKGILSLLIHGKCIFGDYSNIFLKFKPQISKRNWIPDCITTPHKNYERRGLQALWKHKSKHQQNVKYSYENFGPNIVMILTKEHTGR